MATNLGAIRRHPFEGTARWLRWACYHLLSFEAVFVLFLYGTRIRFLLPPIPIDLELFFGLITMAIGAWIVARRGLYVRGLWVMAAVVPFFAWAVMSYAWTPSRLLARDSLLFMCTLHVWALAAGAFVIAPDRERIVRFLVLVLLLGTVVAIAGLAIYVHYGSFRFAHWGSGGDHRAYLGWSYTVADAAAVALAIVLFSRFGSLRQLVAMGLVCMFGLFILVAGARGPLLSIALAAMVGLMVKLPRLPKGAIKLPKAQVLGLALILLGTGYIAYLTATDQLTDTLARFARLFAEAEDTSLRGQNNRLYYYEAAVGFFKDAPIVGHGVYSFTRLYYGREVPGGYPHNVVLQLLVDYGLIGLVLFGFFVWIALWSFSLRRLRSDLLFATVLMVFSTYFVMAMVASDIHRNFRFFFISSLFIMPPPPARSIAAPADPAGEDEAAS